MEVDAFIPGLIQAARQPRIRFGGEGFVDPSRGVRALGVPEGPIDASLGDVHPHGNPHCWMVPENIRIAGENILAGLIRAAPEHEETFRANLRAYLEEVDRRFKVWEARLAPHQGTRVLQFHESWNYLLGHFGFEIAGSVEPKPGIAPSAAHLRRLVDQIRRDEIRLVLAEPFYSERPLRFLHQQTGIGVLRLPLYLGGDPRYTTVLDNLGGIVDQIAAALDDPKTAGPGE